MDYLFKVSNHDNMISYFSLTGFKLFGIIFPKCSEILNRRID